MKKKGSERLFGANVCRVNYLSLTQTKFISHACLCPQSDFNKAKKSRLMADRIREHVLSHSPLVLLLLVKLPFLATRPTCRPSPNRLFSCARVVLLALALSLLSQLNICSRNDDEITDFQGLNFNEGSVIILFFPDERAL